ncbi:MAG: hypothetical protein MUF60_01875 [Vicinamibacterales bacterium]|nr:hypothetical protein [Vicinamibacterales bacterium]
MKHITGLLVVAGLLAASPAAAEMTLTIADGKVTLICDNTPARQILAEWARLGQTKVVGADKLTGPPLTLRLEGVPEHRALEIVLRAASGYIAADRPTLLASASRYDRILIMPPSTPVAGGGAVAARPAAPVVPVAQPYTPRTDPEPVEEAVDQQDPGDMPASPYGGDARPPETNFDYANPQEFLRRRQEMMQQQQQQGGAPATFPGTVLPGGGTPPATSAPTGVPTAPVGTARPGEIVKPPQQPPTFNPYGLPYNVQPGSAPPQGPMQPDRAKYANPYQPTPPQPQDE